jgi:hypothetical protein
MAARDQIRCPQCGVANDPDALFCSRCGASQNRPGYAGRRSGRVTLAGATMALACLIALAATAFVLYTIVTRVVTPSAHADTSSTVYSGAPGTLATLNTTTTAAPSTTTTVSGLTAQGSILVRPQAATASSSLKPTNITDFRPTNLLDGDVATAWVEGASGTGTGQWVKFAFDKPLTLARLEIANGYQKDDQFYANFVRVKSLQIDYSDGTRQVIQLQDQKTLQVVEPKTSTGEAVTTKSIKFTILSVYPTYKFPQAALSDIHVYELAQ